MQNHGELASKNFAEGYNCAQSVFLAFPEVLEELGLTPQSAARLTNCLGGGLSQTGGLCGAVSAACLVVSGKEGRDSPSREGEALARQQKTYRLVQELHRAFAAEFGGVGCPALLERGLAASGDAKNEKHDCPLYVRRSAELAAQAMAQG